MSRDECRRVVVALLGAVDRQQLRMLTARLRDLPGVEMVDVGLGQLIVTGRFDEDEVRALCLGTAPRTREDR